MQQVAKILFFISTSRKKRYIRGDIEIEHKKAAQESDIHSRVIKENSDAYLVTFYHQLLMMQ